MPELAHHLAEHAEAGRTGLVFVGARGGVLRRNNFRRIWLRALAAAGLGDVHFHDLRHTGNTLAATGGAKSPRKIKAQVCGFAPVDLGLSRVLRLVGADGFEPPTSAL
ncbi:hypothetical protein ABZV80_43680 [Streptomyces sp. NPDC005132]|uniref:hypothetical protein n=1 Tax=Streptomyces sp. NPDC005132 TaxID=3154294 RepID=UPI00339DE453